MALFFKKGVLYSLAAAVSSCFMGCTVGISAETGSRRSGGVNRSFAQGRESEISPLGDALRRSQEVKRSRSQESEIRSQEVWNFARNGENAGGFAQGEGKIRVFFQAFSNDFERFFAKINEF